MNFVSDSVVDQAKKALENMGKIGVFTIFNPILQVTIPLGRSLDGLDLNLHQ